MSNYNLKLDLSKLEGFGEITLTGKSGQPVECIVIPKKRNNVFCSEKGGRYLDLVCFETPNSEYGSHLITVSKTKEEQEHEKTTGERVTKPILGNLKPFGSQSSSSGEEYSLPIQGTSQPSQKTKQATTAQQEENNDLPFN